MNTKVLSYENVSITYNGTETIHNVSFDLNRGEILGLLGESGSGKSTLIRAAMGVLDTGGRVSSGRIIYRQTSCPYDWADHNEAGRPKRRPDGNANSQLNDSQYTYRRSDEEPNILPVSCRDEMEINLCTLPEKKFRELRGAKIGMVFQDAGAALCPIRTIGSQIIESLSAHRTVESQITESMSAHRRTEKKEAEAAALDLFEKLNLQDPRKIWDSYPFEMSGGMNQRIGIAMAMLMKPDILLADEPTSALDYVSAVQVLKEMREVQRLFGTSIILVTHDIAVMEKMADRIVVLQSGWIVESGRTDDVLRHPQEPYTKRLIASVPELFTGKEAGNEHTVWNRDLSGNRNGENAEGGDDHDQNSPGIDFDYSDGHTSDADDFLLRAEHLSKTFHGKNGKKTEAVRNVTFTLHRGEILGILGESGSGKSTVARLITGLTTADGGQIRLKDCDENEKKEGKKSFGRIQMVFQNPINSFDPRRTLGYGIRESLMNRGISRREADKTAGEMLARCGLPADYALRYPKEVSGGECQRAAIARALAAEPDILICDEATSSLDVTLQQQIVDLLKDLQVQQNLSVLFICHNLALAQMTCDRILVMNHGRIVEEGTPDRIVNQIIMKKL